MKVKTIQIVWHDKQPVFSVDFAPRGMLATAGGDKEIKLWQVDKGADGDPAVQHVGTLRDPGMYAVNCVRWSPTGTLLASGGDTGSVMVWRENATAQVRPTFGEAEDDKPTAWRPQRFKGHIDDVQDVCWAPDSSALVSGSIDNVCFIWDVDNKQGVRTIKDHKHFVQGVTWDPAGQYITSLSSDRTCRVYGPRPPAAGKKGRPSAAAGTCLAIARDLYCQHVLAKRTMAAAGAENDEAGANAANKSRHFLFHDETLPSFFRRMAWAPDGSVLVVPSGTFQSSCTSAAVNATYLYSRTNWSAPAMVLPGLQKASVAVRFCPRLFQRRQTATSLPAATQPFAAPYRMVYAVATIDSVMLYDTELAAPFAVLAGLHLAAITDLSWSTDGRFLAISSRDGYCSIALFDDGELGEHYPMADLEPEIAERMLAAQKRARPRANPAPKAAQQPATALAAAGQLTHAAASALKPTLPRTDTTVLQPGTAVTAAEHLPMAPGGTTGSTATQGPLAAASGPPVGQGPGEPALPAATLPAAERPAGAADVKRKRRIVPQPVGPPSEAGTGSRGQAFGAPAVVGQVPAAPQSAAMAYSTLSATATPSIAAAASSDSASLAAAVCAPPQAAAVPEAAAATPLLISQHAEKHKQAGATPVMAGSAGAKRRIVPMRLD